MSTVSKALQNRLVYESIKFTHCFTYLQVPQTGCQLAKQSLIFHYYKYTSHKIGYYVKTLILRTALHTQKTRKQVASR